MYTNPSRAAIIFTMEGVTTAVLSYVFLGETMTLVESIGCFLVFVSTAFTAATSEISPLEVCEDEEQESDTKDAVNERSRLISSV